MFPSFFCPCAHVQHPRTTLVVFFWFLGAGDDARGDLARSRSRCASSRTSPTPWSRHAQPVRHEKRGRNTRMMSCDAQRQLTASSERFSRASPTIWSTGERGTYVWAARGARRAWTASRTRASWRGRRTRAPRASRARSRARSSRRRRWATSTRCDDARDGHLLRPVVHGRRRARGRPQWSTDGDAPEGVQGIVSGLHEKSDRDQRALLRK